MCGIKKCSTIIYRLKKYRDTSIPRYFVTSSIVDNFCKIQSYESSECSRRFSAIYVIDTICKLSASGRGCHVAGIYVGLFSERELMFTFATCYRPPSVCLSSVCLSVCKARAPYSGGSNFRQYFYGIRYLGHPLTFTENFTEIVPGEPLRRGS